MEKSKLSDEIELGEDDSDGKNWKGIVIALFVILIICCLVGLAIYIVSLKNKGSSHGEPLKLEDLFNENFRVRKVNGQWIGDTFIYRSSWTGDILSLDLLHNSSLLLFTDNSLKMLGSDNFLISPDLQFMLLSCDVQEGSFGHYNAKYKILAKTNLSRPVHIHFPAKSQENWNTRKLQYASWTSSGSSLTFVYKNNIYFQSTPHTSPVKITDTGVVGQVLNGLPDWLYNEEILHSNQAHWVSPDNGHLAYLQINESLVTRYNYSFFGDNLLYPSMRSIPYPKAGEIKKQLNNPIVKLMVANTNNQKVSYKAFHPPSEFREKEHYVTMVKWLDNKRLLVAWSNRPQNKTIITVCFIETFGCRLNLIENQHENRGWVIVRDVMIIKGGMFYLMISPQPIANEGFHSHVALVSTSEDSDGHKQFLTYGLFDVMEICAFQQDSNQLFYIATDADPRQRHLFKLTLPKDLKEITRPFKQVVPFKSIQHFSFPKTINILNLSPSHSFVSNSSSSFVLNCLTCRTKCKYVSVQFSSSASHYLENCLGPHVPTSSIISVQQRDVEEEEKKEEEENEEKEEEEEEEEEEEKKIEELGFSSRKNDIHKQRGIIIENNRRLRRSLRQKALPVKHFATLQAEDGTELFCEYYLPPMTSKDHLYQFPLLVYLNGGPESQEVTYKFKLNFNSFLTSSQGIIVASVDGRGTKARGLKFMHEVYYRLGVADLDDQVRGIEHLKTMSSVNKDRVAVWGDSYGGFLVSHLMGMRGNGSVNCGIAVSPVVDWRLYDTAYSERYMGRPTSEDNFRGYDNANVLEKVKNFKNKKFFLVHATADDSVHYQHSAMLIKILTEQSIMFQQASYIDSNHDHLLLHPSEQGTPINYHLYRSMLEFLRHDCWNDKKSLELKQQEASSKQKGRT